MRLAMEIVRPGVPLGRESAPPADPRERSSAQWPRRSARSSALPEAAARERTAVNRPVRRAALPVAGGVDRTLAAAANRETPAHGPSRPASAPAWPDSAVDRESAGLWHTSARAGQSLALGRPPRCDPHSL